MLVSGSGKWTHAQRGEAEFVVKAIGDDANECNHLQSLTDHDLLTVEAKFAGGELVVTVTATQPPIAGPDAIPAAPEKASGEEVETT